MCAWEAAGLFASAGCSPGWASPAGQHWAAGGWTPLSACPCLSSPQPPHSHPLLSLGRRRRVPGCSAGRGGLCGRCDCRDGYPSVAAPSAWSLDPSARGLEWFPVMWWELKCVSSQTACVVSWLVRSLAPFGDPWKMKQAATTSLSCFSMQPLFADSMRGPHLCAKLRNTCMLLFRHRFSRKGLHLCLTLSYILFPPSAALVMCTFTPGGFSHTSSELGEAVVSTAASSCLYCVLHPPSSLSLFPFPFWQGTLL